MDQLTTNVVAVAQPNRVEEFVKLPDGTYKEPLGSSASLALNSNLYTYTTEGKVKLAFNSATATNGPSAIATWTSPAGPVVTFNYTGSKLTSVTNGIGRTLTLTYTGASITGVSDGTGRSVSYTYDSSGQLTKFTDADSNPVTYQYDLPGRLTKIFYPSFPANAFVSNTYDGADRVQSQADANGHVTQLYFAGSRTETDDPAGTAQTYYFTPRGKVQYSIDGLLNQTTNTYDHIDRLISTTLPEGNSISLTYDTAASSTVVRLQNVLSITATPKPGSPLSPIVEQFTYDANCADRVNTAKDFNGNQTASVYDPSTCNLTEVDQPAVASGTPKTLYTAYNTRGQLLSKTDPAGKVTAYAYDSGTEELLSVTDDNNTLRIKTSYGYNAAGDINSVTDPDGNITTSIFDNQRRVQTITGPASSGAVANFFYNFDGLVTSTQRATGNTGTPWQTTSATYSFSGKALTTTDANGAVTTNTYDALDRLATVTDPASRLTTYTYDVLSRLKSAVNLGIQSGPLVQYAYTPNGKRLSLIDARNNGTGYVYDGLDRLSKMQFPQVPGPGLGPDPSDVESYTYDANGNALTQTKRDGAVITVTYDALNRPTKKAYPGDLGDITLTYDLDGRVLSAVNGTTASTVGYGYDSAGRLHTETTNSLTMTYGYDLAGNRTTETWPDAFYVTYSYDALNRMTQVAENGAISGPGVLAVYAYDPLSRRTGVNRGNGGSSAYSYNAPGGSLLAGITHTMPAAGAGDNVSLGFTYTSAEQLLTRTSSNTVYDWGNVVSGPGKTYDGLNRDSTIVSVSGYDAKGDVINEGVSGRQFTYDVDNRMIGVTSGSTTANLSYDPIGRLQVDQATVSGTQTTTQFLYDGSRLSAEYNGTTLLRRYVHGPGTDEPIVWYEYTSGSTVRNWLHADERGSVIAATNDNGVATVYSYGPYGEPTAWGGSRFAYTGQIALPEVALYHYKARAYDPIVGRFLQTDPIGYEGGANLYAYVGGDPLDASDPTGLASELNSGSGSNLYGGSLIQADFSSTAAQALLRGATAVGEGTEAVVGAGVAGTVALGVGLAGAVCVAVCPSSTASDDTTQNQQYVLRAGMASASNLIAGTQPTPYGFSGFSTVMGAPGMTPAQIAAIAGPSYYNGTFSVSTVSALNSAGYPVEYTQSNNIPLHATVIAPSPLPPAQAQQLSTMFSYKIPNPSPKPSM
jgi:RHS repeat-associated protein